MNKIFFLLFSLFCLTQPILAEKWKYKYSFDLKKDQSINLFVSYRDKKISLRNGIFTFRWTLYKNKALVTFSSYQKVKSQHVLYLTNILNSFEVQLIPTGNLPSNQVYLWLIFSKFNNKTKKARIDIYIKDNNNKILIKSVMKKEVNG